MEYLEVQGKRGQGPRIYLVLGTNGGVTCGTFLWEPYRYCCVVRTDAHILGPVVLRSPVLDNLQRTVKRETPGLYFEGQGHFTVYPSKSEGRGSGF